MNKVITQSTELKKTKSNSIYTRIHVWLESRTGVENVLFALMLAVLIGIADFLSGYEVSFALFYLLPVALAAWYGGRRVGVGLAIFCCLCWFMADRAAGALYTHPAIAVWNAAVRLGFFVTVSYLLSSLHKNLKYLRGVALLDELTQMYRRPAFDQRLEHDLALATRHVKALSLAYIDLDNFKSVNDRFGHAEGDKVLRQVGQILTLSVRKSDTAARLGGDEFALILPGMSHLDVQKFVQKLHEQLQRALAKHHWEVSCSIGVVTLDGPQMDREQLVAKADELMYEVKRGGKSAVAYDLISAA